MKSDLKLGWLKDPADFRDFTPNSDVDAVDQETGVKTSIKKMLKDLKIEESEENMRPPVKHDLMRIFRTIPVEDQEGLNSCTANAGVSLLEYFVKKVYGVSVDASRLFLYKTTRNLLQFKEDQGAFIRSTIGAMRLFGVLPEKYWEYDEDKVNDEPPAFCYSFAQNYKALKYFRLDGVSVSEEALLTRIKYYIYKGFPLMFGFTVYQSIRDAKVTGEIPFPHERETLRGGHAVVAVGYDDDKEIADKNGGTKVGAIKIRNSWGDWGEDGYGWIPYDYVLKGMATDWWTLIKNDWVLTKRFV